MLLHDCPPRLLTLQETHRDSFFSACPVPPILGPLLICVGVLVPNPSFHVVLARELQTLTGMFVTIPLLN